MHVYDIYSMKTEQAQIYIELSFWPLGQNMQIFYHHLSKSIESGVEYEVEQDQPQQMVWPAKGYSVMFK